MYLSLGEKIERWFLAPFAFVPPGPGQGKNTDSPQTELAQRSKARAPRRPETCPGGCLGYWNQTWRRLWLRGIPSPQLATLQMFEQNIKTSLRTVLPHRFRWSPELIICARKTVHLRPPTNTHLHTQTFCVHRILNICAHGVSEQTHSSRTYTTYTQRIRAPNIIAITARRFIIHTKVGGAVAEEANRRGGWVAGEG